MWDSVRAQAIDLGLKLMLAGAVLGYLLGIYEAALKTLLR
jgi:hypothetical protein